MTINKQLMTAVFVAALGGCAQNGPGVSGSAGGQTSVGADPTLQRCTETVGTIAIDDSRRQSWWGDFSRQTQVTNLEPMIRLIVQQSNCFVVTSLGNADLENQMGRIMQQQRSGEFRAGSNLQRGQRVAADYYLQPTITFRESSAASVAGAVGGVLGFGGVGAVGGLYKESSATVNMSLFDMRAGTQAAASTGTSAASNFGALANSLGGGGGGAITALTASPSGRATLAAFVVAYNDMVVAVKNYKAQTVRGGLGTGGLLKPGN